ncbi:hypothetical protein ON010_g16345 [Phytophthora cinnamomi]|nr:hypothetical protein ON010_g16345 [Phytophthora cinnamomi]
MIKRRVEAFARPKPVAVNNLLLPVTLSKTSTLTSILTQRAASTAGQQALPTDLATADRAAASICRRTNGWWGGSYRGRLTSSVKFSPQQSFSATRTAALLATKSSVHRSTADSSRADVTAYMSPN